MLIYNKDKYAEIMAKFIAALGYKEVKGNSNDGVVDMVARKDGKVYAFACRYDIDAISGQAMEEFIQAARKQGVDVLVFMTNSSFSSAAKKAGEAAGVELWDRNYIDRIAIGVDVRLEEPAHRKESHRNVYIAIGIAAVIILAAAMALYFNPNLFGLFGVFE